MPEINIIFNEEKSEAEVAILCDRRQKSKDPKQWYGVQQAKEIFKSEYPQFEIEKVLNNTTATNYNEESRLGKWIFKIKVEEKKVPKPKLRQKKAPTVKPKTRTKKTTKKEKKDSSPKPQTKGE